MDNEKNLNVDSGAASKEGDFSAESSSRARNRTVMLTPEITGQVRARLAQEIDPAAAPAAPRDGGFESVVGRGGGFTIPTTPEPRGRPEARSDAGFAPPSAAPRQAPAAPAARRDGGIAWSKETPVVGFMVSFDVDPNGEIHPLRSGRVMVSSSGDQPDNCLQLDDPSVSPMHAILRISAGGEIQILDQLSEFGTTIRRFGSNEEEQLSGDKSSLEHGDIVKFGNRTFHVCIIAAGREE